MTNRFFAVVNGVKCNAWWIDCGRKTCADVYVNGKIVLLTKGEFEIAR